MRLLQMPLSLAVGVVAMASNGLNVWPIASSIGAEILGIELVAEPGRNVIPAIRPA